MNHDDKLFSNLLAIPSTTRLSVLLLMVMLSGCQYILGIDGSPPAGADSGLADGSLADGSLADAATCDQLPDWWNCSFTRRRALKFLDTGRLDALQDIPILVRLSAEDVNDTDFASDGADIRFVDGDTMLAHEIERWDPAGESLIWVLVPQIDPDGNDSFIEMYYGNPTATDTSQPHELWEDYELVYHFADSTSFSMVDDSSPSGIAGMVYGGVSPDVTAPIGTGIDFNGSNGSYIYIGRHSQLDSIDGSFMTMEAWFLGSNYNRRSQIFYNESNCRGWRLYTWNTGGLHGRAGNANSCSPGQFEDTIAVANAVSTGEWRHVTLTVDRSTPSRVDVCTHIRYLDGSDIITDGDCETTDRLKFDAAANAEVFLGTNEARQEFYQGGVDELRITAAGPRSSSWLDTQFLSVHNRLIELDAEQIVTF